MFLQWHWHPFGVFLVSLPLESYRRLNTFLALASAACGYLLLRLSYRI